MVLVMTVMAVVQAEFLNKIINKATSRLRLEKGKMKTTVQSRWE